MPATPPDEAAVPRRAPRAPVAPRSAGGSKRSWAPPELDDQEQGRTTRAAEE